MPFAVPSQRGFTKHGKPPGGSTLSASAADRHDDARRDRHAGLRHDRARPRLVERERQRERVRAELRDADHLEQHGRPRLAVAAAVALRDRERGVDRDVALGGGVEQVVGATEAQRRDARAARSPPRARAASPRARTRRGRRGGSSGRGADTRRRVRRRCRSRDEPSGRQDTGAAARSRSRARRASANCALANQACATMRPRPARGDSTGRRPIRVDGLVRAIALVLTVLTGFSGLVYEVTWQKYLATLLGSHSEATAAVLALFLGGLSIGYSLFGARHPPRRAARRGARRGAAPAAALRRGREQHRCSAPCSSRCSSAACARSRSRSRTRPAASASRSTCCSRRC